MSRPFRSKKNKGGFRSLLEKRFNAHLKKLKLPFLYEAIKIPYIIPAKKQNYIPDFIVTKKKLLTQADIQDIVIIETKGRLTARDAKKMVLVKENNPGIDIRFVFPVNSIYHKGKKGRDGGHYRYSDWCEDNGFQYWIGEEPPKSFFEKI